MVPRWSLHIGVQNAFLFQVVGHGVLGKKWCLKVDFGANPFAFGVRGVGRVVAVASTAELRAEVGGLDLIELPDFAPSLVPDRAGNVDF